MLIKEACLLRRILIVKHLAPLSITFVALAQQPARQAQAKPEAEPNVPQDHRPSLFFREDFRGAKAGVHIAPMTQEFIANPDPELKLYGAGRPCRSITAICRRTIPTSSGAGLRNRAGASRCATIRPTWI